MSEHFPPDFPSTDDGPYAALKAFLLSKGLARHKQTGEIADLLALAKTSVFRKFKGDSSFSSLELKIIADHYGTTVGILRGLSDFEQDQPVTELLPELAQIHIAGIPPTGELIIGPALQNDDICDLIAIKFNDGWHVFTRGSPELQDQIPFGVASLKLSAMPRPRIAILEDDPDAAALLQIWFENAGMVAHTFETSDLLITALGQRRNSSYAGYVVDWILGGSNAQTAIEAIRSKQPQAPIAITTGAMNTGIETEGQLIPFAEHVGAGIFEKPFRPAVLASYLRRNITQTT
jgi:CheY-like chemotaxis protein